MAVCGEGGTEFLMFPHCLEKVKSKLVSLKEERLRGTGRVKQFYKANNISLSHSSASTNSMQGQGIISLVLASPLVIFGCRRVLHSPLPRMLNFRHHHKRSNKRQQNNMRVWE